jgi:hypothetical protein
MALALDPEVAAVLAAAGGPPPTPAVGDVASRRAALNAMLDYFNNQARPAPDGVEIVDYQVEAADSWTFSGTRTSSTH